MKEDINTADKPELIAFSQHNLGGVQSFYYNLLTNAPNNFFKRKWLLIESKGLNAALPPAPFNIGEEVIKIDPAGPKEDYAELIAKHIPDGDGIILANHKPELDALTLHPRPNKVIYYLVHDEMYVNLAKAYISIIDVLVTHNFDMYQRLLETFPGRNKQTFYLPYGIQLSTQQRQPNLNGTLKIAFVGRLCVEKGIFDLLLIDDILKRHNVPVDWLVIGDGPEKAKLTAQVASRNNFRLATPATTTEIFNELINYDVYILPSILDGTPVAMLEAMSVGLVPLVYHFNKGIDKIVTPDIGYIVPVKAVKKAAAVIMKLNADRRLLERQSAAALNAAQTQFNVKDRAADYYTLFERYNEFRGPKSNHVVHIDHFVNDTIWPDFVVRLCRRANFLMRRYLKR